MKLFPLLLLFAISMSSCRKQIPEPEQPVSPLTGTRMQLTLDSIFLYASQVYLWSDALPSYTTFNPRQYDVVRPELSSFQKELFDLTQFKTNPETSKPYELPLVAGNARYSYLEAGTASGIIASLAGSSQLAILNTSHFSSGNNNIAYLALGSFPKLSSCKAELDNAFEKLSTTKPTRLIVDLRSNRGGYVETAEYILNLMVNSQLNGKLMYTEQYNSNLQSAKATLLRHQPYLDAEGNTIHYQGRVATLADVDYSEKNNRYLFSKKGRLETIESVWFIVSSRTASAAEMLISCLKPYLPLRLAGTTTYGKPVGFLPVKIDQYSIYYSAFLIRNAQGWSDYYNGIPVDINITGPVNPQLGDPDEPCLKAVLEDINGIRNHATITELPLATSSSFSGMIETRLKIKR